MQSTSYDVVVVGAGLAGLQCAENLGREGLRVLLLDAKPAVSARVHTSGILVRRTLEDFPLPPELLGPPIRRVVLYSPARRALGLESAHDEFRIARMADLYEWCLRGCRAAGVDYAGGHRFLAAERANGGLSLHVQAPDGVRSLAARLVVGADGAKSQVALAFGLDRNACWLVGNEEVYRDAREGPGELHCFLDPELAPGYIAWLARDGEEVHIGVAGYPERFAPAQALARFRDSVHGLFDARRASLVERRGGLIPVGGVLRRIASEDCLLVGDAAGAVSPLTAGGLDPCFRLSRLAARTIADFLRTGDRGVLRRYSGARWRRRFFVRRLLRGLMARTPPGAWIEAACSVLQLPLVRHVAGAVFFGRGSFPDRS